MSYVFVIFTWVRMFYNISSIETQNKQVASNYKIKSSLMVIHYLRREMMFSYFSIKLWMLIFGSHLRLFLVLVTVVQFWIFIEFYPIQILVLESFYLHMKCVLLERFFFLLKVKAYSHFCLEPIKHWIVFIVFILYIF